MTHENPQKPNFMIIRQLPATLMSVGSQTILLLPAVCDLGVYNDADWSMRTRAEDDCRLFRSAASSPLVPHPLTAWQMLGVSHVSNRLDFGNATLADNMY